MKAKKTGEFEGGVLIPSRHKKSHFVQQASAEGLQGLHASVQGACGSKSNAKARHRGSREDYRVKPCLQL